MEEVFLRVGSSNLLFGQLQMNKKPYTQSPTRESGPVPQEYLQQTISRLQEQIKNLELQQKELVSNGAQQSKAIRLELDSLKQEEQNSRNPTPNSFSPPVFDGTTPVDEFIRKFRNVASANDWNEQKMKKVIPICLEGLAEAWFLDVGKDKLEDSFKSFMEGLTQAFGGKISKKHLLKV